MICVENQRPCSSVMNDYHIDESMTFETVVVGGTGGERCCKEYDDNDNKGGERH